MRFALAREHRDFFNAHHLIQFEGMIPPNELEELNGYIDKALSDRLKIASYQLKNQQGHRLFDVGRDLWRVNMSLRKIVLDPQLAKIAGELVRRRDLRIGYDQYLPGFSPYLTQQDQKYTKLLNESHPLDQSSCVSQVACGLLICLSASEEKVIESLPAENSVEPIDSLDPVSLEPIAPLTPQVFGTVPGSITYFTPDYPIPYPILKERQGCRYLLIVYVESTAQYLFEERDYNGHELKHLGYVFGDKLNDKLNPIVLRK